VGDLAEIERQTLENIQNLSLQHPPQVKDPYEFLAKFFSTNFSISDIKIPLKITPLPSSQQPRKNHKRKKSSEISQNNQITDFGKNGQIIPTKNSEKEQSGKNSIKKSGSQGKISRRLSEGNIKKTEKTSKNIADVKNVAVNTENNSVDIVVENSAQTVTDDSAQYVGENSATTNTKNSRRNSRKKRKKN